MKTMLAFSLFFTVLEAFASLTYYPESTLAKFSDQKISTKELREEIFNLSAKIHIINEGSHDTLADTCPSEAECIGQKQNLTYDEARRIMFGELFLESHGANKYSVKEVYCNITIDQNQGVGPNRIPNPNYVNCEHTWPQSKFSKQFPSELQKADLHHLFPSDMKANSTRNNFPFAEVDGKITHNNCHDSKIGNALGTNLRSFEPPVDHKGNVARALYYFSTRYKMKIDETQAKYLKKWNNEDPVDEAEMIRNDKIMQQQGNRNPFIDYPELINRL